MDTVLGFLLTGMFVVGFEMKSDDFPKKFNEGNNLRSTSTALPPMPPLIPIDESSFDYSGDTRYAEHTSLQDFPQSHNVDNTLDFSLSSPLSRLPMFLKKLDLRSQPNDPTFLSAPPPAETTDKWQLVTIRPEGKFGRLVFVEGEGTTEFCTVGRHLNDQWYQILSRDGNDEPLLVSFKKDFATPDEVMTYRQSVQPREKTRWMIVAESNHNNDDQCTIAHIYSIPDIRNPGLIEGTESSIPAHSSSQTSGILQPGPSSTVPESFHMAPHHFLPTSSGNLFHPNYPGTSQVPGPSREFLPITTNRVPLTFVSGRYQGVEMIQGLGGERSGPWAKKHFTVSGTPLLDNSGQPSGIYKVIGYDWVVKPVVLHIPKDVPLNHNIQSLDENLGKVVKVHFTRRDRGVDISFDKGFIRVRASKNPLDPSSYIVKRREPISKNEEHSVFKIQGTRGKIVMSQSITRSPGRCSLQTRVVPTDEHEVYELIDHNRKRDGVKVFAPLSKINTESVRVYVNSREAEVYDIAIRKRAIMTLWTRDDGEIHVLDKKIRHIY